LDMGGETLFRRVKGWTFGDRPADEDAVHFQPEVVMESCRPVLLDDEAVLAGGLGGAFRLGRLAEIAFALVVGKRTRHRIQFDRMVSMASKPRPAVRDPDAAVTQHLITHRRVMHACGHDVHMAIALELARSLSERRHELPGMVRFAFQPAEEQAGGAKPMIDAGVLDGIDRVIGLHVWSQLPTGQVCVPPGVVMASADMFTLIIRGRSGHGAQPNLTIDAVVIAAQVVTALQTLVSRET